MRKINMVLLTLGMTVAIGAPQVTATSLAAQYHIRDSR